MNTSKTTIVIIQVTLLLLAGAYYYFDNIYVPTVVVKELDEPLAIHDEMVFDLGTTMIIETK